MRCWWIFSITIPLLVGMARAELPEAQDAAAKFEVPAGFKVEAVAAEPLLKNPVAISMDERGRMFVAETRRLDNAVVDITKNTNWLRSDLKLRTVTQRETFLTNAFGTNAYILTKNSEALRMLVPGPGGIFSTSRVVWGGFQSVGAGLMAGVLARPNRIYVTCIPYLLRLDDLDLPTEAHHVLSTGYGVHIGVTGHDLHGLALGMDGKIYFSMGDRGLMVRLPGATLNYPDTGAVLRCNQDGSQLEVFATGLRNPQELTFDEFGNLWTADNDTAGEDKCRLIHVVEGADYGWRTSYQHMKGYGPWVQEKVWEGGLDGVLPNAGEPAQGPAGFAFYPGTGLPAAMNGRFLLCDFPGGIQSFAVEPKGASYVIKDKKRFLWNAWPTDIEFGTDGSLYFSDWVSGWTLPNIGRIYRVTHPDVLADPKTESTAKILQGTFEDKDAATLLGYLEHHDLRVRQNAHLALAKKKDAAAALRALATDATKSRAARVHAIWALRLQGPIEPAVVDQLIADPEAEIRAQAVGSAAMTNVIKLLKDENARVRFYAASAMQKKALYDPNNSANSEAILDFLEKNGDADPYLTHAGVRVLIYSQPALLKARKHSSPAVRRAALLALRALGSISTASFLEEPALAYEAARAINDVPIPTAYAKLAQKLTTNCPPQMLSRAINVNLRLGGSESARRLANFAAAASAPVNARVNALECLADWEEPDELDRVVGLWRPVPADISKRPEALAVAALQPKWNGLWQDKNSEIVKAALKCVTELDPPGQATNVLAVFQDASRPADVRAVALEVLGGLGDTNFAPAIEMALKNDTLRVGALRLVQTNSPPEVLARVIDLASQKSDVRAAQAAYGVIGKIAPANAADTLKKDVERLGRKELPGQLALDVLQAAMSYPALKESAEAAAKTAFQDPFAEPLLLGGDATEGRRVFEERSDVACTRCHAVKGAGGTVGPALDGIGGRVAKEYLLESILFPNKAIAKGFENVVITYTSGQTISGTLVNEGALAYEINSPEDGPVTVRKTAVRSIARSLSAMPDGLGQMLSPFELRNLVEYLASLK